MVNVTALTLPRLEVLKISLLKGTQQVTILRTKQSTYKPINHNTHFIIATNIYYMKNCQKGTLNDMENNVLIQDQSYFVSFLWRPVASFPEGLNSYQKSLDDRLSIGNCKIPDKTDLPD